MFDNNKKIAKELNRIAKSLASNAVANNAGLYKNFTGTIDWLGSHGEVSNATFELSDRAGIIWKKGLWKKGFWKNGTWEDGTWEKGTWKKGLWKDGFWKNGIWEYGIWEDGTWKDGTWYNGTWEDGTWEEGKDKNMLVHLHSPDNW